MNPGRTRIKICGITREEDLDAAVHAGADAVGFVRYAKSPRHVSAERAAALAARLPPFVTPVLLWVQADPAEIADGGARIPNAVHQFHGDETPEQCRAAGRPYLRAVRMAPGVDLLDCASRFSDAQALLLDASNVPAMVLKGRRIFEARGATEAEAYFREALGRAKSKGGEAEVLINLAELQLLRDDLEATEASVARLETLAPNEIPTRYLRARIQAQTGDYPAAILGLQRIMNEAVEKKIALVEIIPGKGSGQLKKRVLRFLDQKHIRAMYHRVEKDDKNFGRIFVHFKH